MIGTDQEKWALAAQERLAKQLGVTWGPEHHSFAMNTESPYFCVWFSCSCGWRRSYSLIELLTTKSPQLRSILVEHVLSKTPMDHFTYYPTHAQGR